ncbi:MAG: amidohydrolase [Clostridiales bacterium]|nr:amidohydrolase [Clostridiales bacterium]
MDREMILSRAKELQEDMRAWRRELHRHPETGMDTPRTRDFVMETLRGMGYQPQKCGQCGVTALAGQEGPCILLRADMDALPITEEADVPYRSQVPGRMHACGHDNHTAMLLGAAKILKEQEPHLPCRVKFMFQPGEEIFAGASDMVENGVLDNPKVEAAMMIHVLTGSPVPAGTLLVMDGGCGAASSDQFTITVRGKGGHGAQPQDTVDPITIAAQIHLMLPGIIGRELAPGTMGVITTGVMQAGQAANVIPDTAMLAGTIRTGGGDTAQYTMGRIREISRDTAHALRGEAQVEFSRHCPPLLPDRELSDRVLTCLEELFPGQVVSLSKQSGGGTIQGGSEDFAFIAQRVPSAAVMLSLSGSGEEYAFAPHHPKARFDDDALYVGAAAYVGAARGLRPLDSACGALPHTPPGAPPLDPARVFDP